MKIKDERIKKYVERLANEKNIDLQKFLNPSLDDLRDANLLKNMALASEKIKNAINSKKKIVIFGDYDCDGVTSSAILYLFFRSLGANVQVYIPNRFENGYGISVDAIEEIQAEFMPDLIVTVDLGITAVEEVEILKQEGIDIVITDHHIPLAEIPDCVVVDPKLDDGSYGFDALCGAGVALKLVEAMAGRQKALEYIDLCAVATVGDIVPLVDENRIISKFGIDKINSGNCHKSLTFLKNKLELKNITSTDISFKIVPRINACGRMDSAMKAFEFLVEEDENLLREKYIEIEADNFSRLKAIEDGNKKIQKQLDNYDLTDPSILVKGEFHEGVIGILASRVCHEFDRPAIIFTTDENGNLKGSGRSTSEINIHEIIASMSSMLENFGGHKMACGVEINPDLFDEFKLILNQKISALGPPTKNDDEFDEIEICEDDLNENFMRQLEILEPFGCENEKPVLTMFANRLQVDALSEKLTQHIKITTSQNHHLIAFNFYNQSYILKTNSKKKLYMDLSWNYFNGKQILNAQLKDLKVIKPIFSEDVELDFMSALHNKYFSIFDFNNKQNYHICKDIVEVACKKLAESSFGTIIVASTEDDLKLLDGLGIETEKLISHKPSLSGKNTICVSPVGIYNLNDVKHFKNIIFLHSYFSEQNLYFSQKLNVFVPEQLSNPPVKLDKSREVFVSIYKHISNFIKLKCNDEIDFALKLHQKSTNFSASEILYCLIVFMELNFIEFDDQLSIFKFLKSKKMELSASKFYGEV